MINWISSKLKTFALAKDTARKIIIQKIIFANHVSEKGLVSRTFFFFKEKPLTLNSKKTTQFFKWQTMWTDTKPKKIYGWQTNTWKDAQHYQLSGKHKLKPHQGNSLAVQWLGLHTFIAKGLGSILVGKLISCMTKRQTNHIKTLLPI